MQPLDFGAVLRSMFRLARTASLVMIAISALVVGRQVYDLWAWFHGIHPVLGVLFLGLVGFLTYIGAVKPIRKYWAMPEAVTPPDLAPSVDVADGRDLVRRTEYLAAFAENLARNPRLSARTTEAFAVRDESALLAIEAAQPGCDIEGLRQRVKNLECGPMEALLKPLDDEANQAIRGEALAVGLGTAVSMSGALDAWIVLWRNLNLVVKLAAIYYGRPGIRGSLFVLRDVATAMFLASKMQGVVQSAGGLLGTWFGGAGGALMGPVADGAMNAFITVRIGYVAKARCRAHRKWTEASTAQVVGACFKEAASQARGVIADLAKAVGGGLAGAASEVWKKTAGFLSSLVPKGDPTPAA